MGRRAILLVAILAFAGSSVFDPRATALGVSQPATVEPVRDAAIRHVVSHSPPITIGFVGPARFAGVTFNADGSVVTTRAWYGTITRTEALVDVTQRVNHMPYGHVVQGPLNGLWVKLDTTLTLARGRTPSPPACRYDDIPTSRTSYRKHAITLLDTIYKLGRSYEPPDLRDSGNYSVNAGYRVRSIIGADLSAMARAARAAGAPIRLVSAYRSYSQQAATFNYWVSVGGYQQALLTSARPGHSEHQLGTTIDVTSKAGAAPWNYADWATTAAGAWMKRHAWKFGFVMTYPQNSTALTCYAYEPWHFRYVGRPIAAAVHASGMPLRVAIWAAYGP